MSASLKIHNPAATALRLMKQERNGAEWFAATPVAVVQPLADAVVQLVPATVRVIIELGQPDDIAIAIDNPSQTNTLRVSTAERHGGKIGAPKHAAFLAPNRNACSFDTGTPQTSGNFAVNAKRVVLVEMLPT